VACRVLGVSASGFYEWRSRSRGPSARQRADEQLTATITAIHQRSRGSNGSRGCMPSCGWARACGAAANGSRG
jgi:hypothetical protein